MDWLFWFTIVIFGDFSHGGKDELLCYEVISYSFNWSLDVFDLFLWWLLAPCHSPWLLLANIFWMLRGCYESVVGEGRCS